MHMGLIDGVLGSDLPPILSNVTDAERITML